MPDCRQPFLHRNRAGQQPRHRIGDTRLVDQCVEQHHHAAAFGQHRHAARVRVANRANHRYIRGQAGGMQFGITARQPQASHGGKAASRRARTM
jgi:hypothetical protein